MRRNGATCTRGKQSACTYFFLLVEREEIHSTLIKGVDPSLLWLVHRACYPLPARLCPLTAWDQFLGNIYNNSCTVL